MGPDDGCWAGLNCRWLACSCCQPPSHHRARVLAAPTLPPQRISFPSLTKQCQPGTSCTACMCSLSKAMQVAKSDPHDLSLCMKNFRWVWGHRGGLGSR